MCAIDGREITLHDERLTVSLSKITTLTLVSATNEAGCSRCRADLYPAYADGQSKNGLFLDQNNTKTLNDIVMATLALDHNKFRGWTSNAMSMKRLTYRRPIEIAKARWEEVSTGHGRMQAMAHPRFKEIVGRLKGREITAA